MIKIYCHINQCSISVQYFARLHANKYCMIAEKPVMLKNMFTLTFIGKDKCRCMMQLILQQNFCLMTYAHGRTTESLCSVTKAFNHTIKQL